MADHRRPQIPFSDAPRGTCRWCGEPIHHSAGARKGQLDRRRRWHPLCVDVYNSTHPRELRRRVRRRDRGRCAICGLDTYALKRRMKGRGMWRRLGEQGFVRRRSLWELDHVVPLIEGGSHELSNLQTLCVPCHKRKSAREHSRRAADTRRARTQADERDVDRELEVLLERVERANERVAASLRRAGGASATPRSTDDRPACAPGSPRAGSRAPRARRRDRSG